METFKNLIFVVVGFIAFACAVIGIVLPILPTTPFLLLASFCFVRGSEKFDKWFKETKIYKKHLETFVRERAMTIKQKLSILLFADFMIAFPLIILKSIPVKIILILVILCKYYYFIFKIKTIKVEVEKV
ncbi:uncharacterized membrane protein YbaN (DUF454 family) [Clostridium punense]|uniref:Uncharacterized membrane protein YbaN (DUF454 family) n=1 Tax=Clostridium punense TaxID=1054297 RepID=A0ABS4K4H5_9CLOT|nr:YbaN family protein [Clostridium sp. BL8]EQB89448.1 hypothetical protein M918_02760 [Clostridium sp. BL8]MBP2022161.1 uncharacterized membrane protein YbaN (DUF454 family) [Clostridium punense]